MFEIRDGENDTVHLSGRFDASQEKKAREFLDGVAGSRIVDFSDLEYISSAGLGVLLRTQKRLKESGGGLKIINVSKHIRDIFFYSGLTKVFEID